MTMTNMSQSMMTLRDWFAIHAPVEIPPWFDGWSTQLPEPKPDVDALVPDMTDEERREVVEWQHDGTWDLDGRLAPVQAALNAWRKRRDEYKRREQQDRYIAWRWHYADLMLQARESPGTD